MKWFKHEECTSGCFSSESARFTWPPESDGHTRLTFSFNKAASLKNTTKTHENVTESKNQNISHEPRKSSAVGAFTGRTHIPNATAPNRKHLYDRFAVLVNVHPRWPLTVTRLPRRASNAIRLSDSFVLQYIQLRCVLAALRALRSRI